MQSTPIEQRYIRTLSIKVFTLQQRTEPIKETRNNITSTQNDNMTIPHSCNDVFDLNSIIQNTKNVASSNLQ